MNIQLNITHQAFAKNFEENIIGKVPFLFSTFVYTGCFNCFLKIWQVEPNIGSSKILLQTPASVRCLDVSASRGCLAVVDESSICRVYSLATGELLYTVIMFITLILQSKDAVDYYYYLCHKLVFDINLIQLMSILNYQIYELN